MTTRGAWALNAPTGQTRQDTRLAPLGTMTPTAELTTRAGVVPGGNPFALSGAGMVGTVATGRAVVQGTSAQGAYPMVVTAPEAFTVANGHASLTRIDAVFLVTYDQLFDTSGQTAHAIVYTQGTPGSGSAPAAPTTGTAYLKLYEITVPAGASSGSPINWGTAVTDKRVYTVALGGVQPVSTAADLAAAGVYVGQCRYNVSRGCPEYWTGAAWQAQGDYTNYTPTWTSDGTAPVLNNGTLTGRYTRIGKRVEFTTKLTIGSTTTVGSGTYSFSLPVQAANNADFIGALFVGDSSIGAAGYSTGIAYLAANASTVTAYVGAKNASSSVGAANPQAMASGDRIWVSGSYEGI